MMLGVLKHRQSGFTLVEVLVALAVFAVIAASGTVIVGETLRYRDQAEDRAERLRSLQVTRAILKADLAQAVGGSLTLPGEQSQTEEYGQPALTGFKAGTPTQGEPFARFVRRGWSNPGGLERRGSLQLVEYYIEDATLYRRSSAHVRGTPETPVTVRSLLSGLTNLDVAAFAGDRWLNDTPEGVFPTAVAFDMDIRGLGSLRQAYLVGGSRR